MTETPATPGALADSTIAELARRVLDICRARRFTVATAESCTGGLVAGALTAVAGSSDVVESGYVTYSNAAKERLLGVPHDTLLRHGAVSRETAEAMALGVLAHAPVDLSVAITGIAGPGGGTPEKPVGLVHFAAALRGRQILHRECRFGDRGREAVRRAAVREALTMLEQLADRRSVRR